MKPKYQGIWESNAKHMEIYPGLGICDDRVSGSITVINSRLPLWCLTGPLSGGMEWDTISADHDGLHGLTRESFFEFVHHILDLRGEFARLICTLAEVERKEIRDRDVLLTAWWERQAMRRSVINQLRRCLECLEQVEAGEKQQ